MKSNKYQYQAIITVNDDIWRIYDPITERFFMSFDIRKTLDGWYVQNHPGLGSYLTKEALISAIKKRILEMFPQTTKFPT